MATVYKVHEAKTHLSKLLERAVAGEEVVIARGDKPQVRLVPVNEAKRPKREFGSMKGQFGFDESFFDPLPDEELRAWGGL